VALLEFWEVLAFLANSALFLVIGLEFDITDLQGRTLAATGIAIGGMLVGRAVISFGLLQVFRGSKAAPVPKPWRMAVFWGGLRGSIPIALVLGLPERQFAGIDAVAMVFGVVLFSLVVQGLTYKPILDKLGLTSKSDEVTKYEELLAHTIALRAANAELDSMKKAGEIVPALFADLHQELFSQLTQAEVDLEELARDASGVREQQVRLTARRLAAAQKATLSEAARSGRIGEGVARAMSKRIEIALEEGAIAREAGVAADPTLYPDRTE
jgi:CPA1 family monovalent cation:H+ antiporter